MGKCNDFFDSIQTRLSHHSRLVDRHLTLDECPYLLLSPSGYNKRRRYFYEKGSVSHPRGPASSLILHDEECTTGVRFPHPGHHLACEPGECDAGPTWMASALENHSWGMARE